jgi:hypothetical protein
VIRLFDAHFAPMNSRKSYRSQDRHLAAVKAGAISPDL